jgi:NAD(P)-dependent dehydrogenase (short-subunit alcohol dehydrogenase family)
MMAAQSEFAGVPVAVVGGHLGVGPAVVSAFVDAGAKVAVGVLGGAKAELPGAQSLPVELADRGSVAGFLDACEQRLGGLSVLVMVAPPVKARNALDFSDDEYRSIVHDELLGPVACILEAARRMVARGSGRIISFSSMSGKTGVHKHVAPYAAAKGGLIAFSRSLAADLAPTGVTVNVIATSLFDAQVAGQSPEKLAETLKGIPVGRVGRSEEAAHAVLFLASRNAGYVTGETMSLSGGRFMD